MCECVWVRVKVSGVNYKTAMHTVATNGHLRMNSGELTPSTTRG